MPNKCSKCGDDFDSKELLFQHIGAKHLNVNDPSLFTLSGLTSLFGTSIPLVDRPPSPTTIKQPKPKRIRTPRQKREKKPRPTQSKPKQSKYELVKKEEEVMPISLNSSFRCTQLLENQETCGLVFEGCCYFSKHFLREHEGKKLTKCLICERSLKEGNLVEKPNVDQQYKCHVCFKVYMNEFDLEAHLDTHLKEKPHECQDCGKRFTQASGLANHMAVHSDEYSYSCEFCPKRFKYKSGLTVHAGIHVNEKPYECVVCSKQYKYLTNLKCHMRRHTNVKPYGCPFCDDTFRLNSQLKRHIRRLHLSNTLEQVDDQDIEVDIVDHSCL